ncbi:hypothetical protein D9M71_127680 [compost metagenome]
MGFSISLTGVIVFFFFAFMSKISQRPSRTWGSDFFACIAMIGLFAIPAGAIIQILE